MDDLEKEYLCPHCNVSSIGSLWTYCEPYCEDCGNHCGVRCPACDEEVDPVWHDGFNHLLDELMK